MSKVAVQEWAAESDGVTARLTAAAGTRGRERRGAATEDPVIAVDSFTLGVS
jgi:hypothetical protein